MPYKSANACKPRRNRPNCLVASVQSSGAVDDHQNEAAFCHQCYEKMSSTSWFKFSQRILSWVISNLLHRELSQFCSFAGRSLDCKVIFHTFLFCTSFNRSRVRRVLNCLPGYKLLRDYCFPSIRWDTSAPRTTLEFCRNLPISLILWSPVRS